MRREGKLLILCLIAVLVAALAVIRVDTHFSHAQAESNWHNAITACERGNPKWKAFVPIVEREATDAPTRVERRAAQRHLAAIRSQPFVRVDGTTECTPAYPEPDAPPEP